MPHIAPKIMARIELQGIRKTFRTRGGEVRAVDDLHLHIDDGELLVLLGPSGCGKTTTLRLIAGLEQPDAGTIRIGDRCVNDADPRDRDVAMVFQDYALYPHMTVLENLSFGLKMRRVPKAEIRRQVAETAELLGLTPLLDRKPAALSGGECQRVALGRAIVRHPNVFLFDEPLSNLDAPQRLRMRAELKRLQRRLRVTTLHVTHDQEEAMALGDRIAVLHRGRLLQVGPPEDVYRRPADRFVAGFVGMPPMNILRGRLQRDGDTLVFRHDGGGCPLPASLIPPGVSNEGGEILLGIRPEHLWIGNADSTARSGITIPLGTARVVAREPLGDRALLHLSLGEGVPVTIRAAIETTVEESGRIDVFAEADRLHVFSANGEGKRLM